MDLTEDSSLFLRSFVLDCLNLIFFNLYWSTNLSGLAVKFLRLIRKSSLKV